MATQLIGTALNSGTHSIGDAQSGINVESMAYSAEPEFREPFLNIGGHVAGEAVGDSMTTLTITGETIRNAGALQGLLASDFSSDETSTLVLTNSGPPMDGPDTEYVAQNADLTQTRGVFETCSVVYIARSNLAVT